VFIFGYKQTTDLAKAMRFHVERPCSKQFYSNEGIMEVDEFEEVSWKDLGGTI